MNDYSFRMATLEDARELAPRLRDEDKAEILAYSGASPLFALEHAIRSSDIPVCIEIYGRPSVLFGAGASVGDPDAGLVWMLSDYEITLGTARTRFLRECRPWVEALHTNYPLLYNYVDARNTVHIRWLKWCGFQFLALHDQFGAAGLPFWEFCKLRKETHV